MKLKIVVALVLLVGCGNQPDVLLEIPVPPEEWPALQYDPSKPTSSADNMRGKPAGLPYQANSLFGDCQYGTSTPELKGLVYGDATFDRGFGAGRPRPGSLPCWAPENAEQAAIAKRIRDGKAWSEQREADRRAGE